MPLPRTPEGRPALPTGLRRRLARLPIGLYRAGLGPLLGKRLLLLHHKGRVSGQHRRVVLEVVAHDAEAGTWTLASGFGPKSAWYQNLRHTPRTLIQHGAHRYVVDAHFLDSDEGALVMARYAPEHPRTARKLCSFMGFEWDGSEESFREAGRQIPFVRLELAHDAQRRP